MMLAVVIAIAIVTVAIPTCQMVACSMDMSGGMMRVFPAIGGSIHSACDGTWMSSTALLGVESGGMSAMLLMLCAAMVVGLMAFTPQVHVQRVRIDDANAPPPPRDPRGERFLL
jgi:hypothetical protein